jgi:hypothetical protein
MFLLAWSFNLMNFLGNIVSIMRPEGEGPSAVADEVGVIVCNTEIVELLLPTGQPQRCDRHALTQVQTYNPITRFQLSRRRPALAEDIKRMLRWGTLMSQT